MALPSSHNGLEALLIPLSPLANPGLLAVHPQHKPSARFFPEIHVANSLTSYLLQAFAQVSIIFSISPIVNSPFNGNLKGYPSPLHTLS